MTDHPTLGALDKISVWFVNGFRASLDSEAEVAAQHAQDCDECAEIIAKLNIRKLVALRKTR